MFYFGRIISAFFNQLFRFLFWNKFGQKILIAIIIGFIAFWCVGMTKVHAVEEVNDINYEVRSYYDGVVNDAIIRLNRYFEKNGYNNDIYNRITNENYIYYFYYGQQDGSSYNNAKPLGSQNLNILFRSRFASPGGNITNYDYMGVTGYTMYYYGASYGFTFTQNEYSSNFSNNGVYYPIFSSTYINQNWKDYILALQNNDMETITELLEDIKAEQQATNDFLTDDTMDETNIDIPSPTLDTTTQDTDTSIHNSINNLTTSLQNTITNYYERLGRLRLGYTYA